MEQEPSAHPAWSKREFEILVGNYLATDQQLAGELTHRSIQAIHLVREFIHADHEGRNSPRLSIAMRSRLRVGQGLLTCPICRSAIKHGEEEA